MSQVPIGKYVMEQLAFDWDDLARRNVPQLWTVDEIYRDICKENLTVFYEDERLERKPAGINAEPLATYVCMWANTPPDGGLIVVGVEDEGTITGCSARAEHVNEVERRIRSDLVPDASFETKKILVENKDGQPDYITVYRVQFRATKLIETNKGESYIRRVSSRHLVVGDEKRELQMERGQLSFELEPCLLKWPDDFDSTAIQAWAAAVHRRKGLQFEPTLTQLLVAHRLGANTKGDFVPNNACALLFAKDPQKVVPGCMVRFQRIEGRHAATGKDRNVVKDIPLTGTIPQLVESTAEVLQTYLREYSKLGRGGKFFTSPEYPEEAWREAIINACVHRSYSLGGANIFVRMFDDRLVVESPGGFPALVTPDNIYEVHYRRNWWLMDALQYLEYVKCENEGAKRIQRAMLEMDLPEPQFEQKEIGGATVRVTLRNNQECREAWLDAEVPASIPPAVAKDLTALDRRLINFAVEHDNKIKTTEAMKLLPKPRWGTANRLLKALAAKGIMQFVSRYARDPTAYFEITATADAPPIQDFPTPAR